MAVHGFRRSLGGRISVRLDQVERGILADLVGQLVELVTPDDAWDTDADPLARLVGIDPNAERSDDPALARLFPDAYGDDDEAAAEFRRFTERSLRDTKLANARAVLGSLERSGEKLVLSDADAQAWLGTLNDVRLALGSRIGVAEDSHELLGAIPESDPSYVLMHVYDWLTFLQETLVHAVTGLVSEPPPGAED